MTALSVFDFGEHFARFHRVAFIFDPFYESAFFHSRGELGEFDDDRHNFVTLSFLDVCDIFELFRPSVALFRCL